MRAERWAGLNCRVWSVPQRYEAQGRDDYLFRLDNDWVVDATIKVRLQTASDVLAWGFGCMSLAGTAATPSRSVDAVHALPFRWAHLAMSGGMQGVWIEQDRRWWWCMLQGNKARFINHACDPNCYSAIKQASVHKGTALRCLLQQQAAAKYLCSWWQPQDQLASCSRMQSQQTLHRSARWDGLCQTAGPAVCSDKSCPSPASCSQVNGTNHICIFTKRAIAAGEELCYDYKVRRQAACAQCRCDRSSIAHWHTAAA